MRGPRSDAWLEKKGGEGGEGGGRGGKLEAYGSPRFGAGAHPAIAWTTIPEGAPGAAPR